VANTGCYAVAGRSWRSPRSWPPRWSSPTTWWSSRRAARRAGRSAKVDLLAARSGRRQRVPGRRAPARPGESCRPAGHARSRSPFAGTDARGILPRDCAAGVAELGPPTASGPRWPRPMPASPSCNRPARGPAAAHLRPRAGSKLRAPAGRRRPDSARVIVTSAIDNLGKGAAGRPSRRVCETSGLSADGIAP